MRLLQSRVVNTFVVTSVEIRPNTSVCMLVCIMYAVSYHATIACPQMSLCYYIKAVSFREAHFCLEESGLTMETKNYWVQSYQKT